MAKKSDGTDGPVIVKKYANRRLYNTASSSYITLDDLAGMVRENVEFQVLDAKTGDDITHSILTQIIMDEESNGEQMLPVSFLRELISLYGNSMQNMMPSYLDAAMANFRENQGKIREAFENSPLAKLQETQMAMMRAATKAFMPGAVSQGAKATAEPEAEEENELDALRKQMAAMQKKLDDLGN
ncbi:polyhydroxyalkanoate synthesis repressor PhaR [Erythrobacteraceae bacterium E2-1 Yellow Sea]|nr:polyhydroxyalkanoate synthesis repressor PhaR [Erythrobacteraceae bacterium E2-1 Yellow Sea]